MAYRNKTYVAFDGDRDIHYYYLMKAWRDNENADFNFYDAHDINTARDTSLETTVKQRLRTRMANASTFMLLVGEGTRYLYKFVRWECELAISKDLPLIVVNLNGTRAMDSTRCPPVLQDQLAIHVPFKQAIVQYALDHWPSSHRIHRGQNKSGPFYYENSVYRQLGL